MEYNGYKKKSVSDTNGQLCTKYGYITLKK